jgi:branched-chain amino acid transport system substrate-binding protein
MTTGRTNWACALVALAATTAAMTTGAAAQQMPGVTKTEIKIGNTDAYSGPASAYASVAKGDAAYFRMVNDEGGINGRKVNFISLDDGYSPPKTVEQVRRLVEQDEVAFIFNPLGTPTNSAIQKYLNLKKVPQLLVSSGADKWANPKEFPWTIGWQPSYRTEAQIYTRYILANKPDAKIALLYQNDDFGKDYVAGVRDVLGDRFDKLVVKSVSYEVTDPTIDSQVVSLQGAGADTLIVGATPKFAAQAIRKVADIGWKPLFFLTNVSISVGSVLEPAGVEKATGIISAAYQKDPGDPKWKDDPGMNRYRAFFAKYLPGADINDNSYEFGYGVTMTMVAALKQCGDDLSRANILKQTTNLHDIDIPTLLPGVKVETSPTNYHPIRQMQLERWTGKNWELFGSVIEGAGS